MIEDFWPRIGGMYAREDGTIGCVWMAHDKANDLVHLYDACMFEREVLAVVAEGLNARGRHTPVAWTHREIADALLERGCNMLPEPCDDTDASAEIAARDVWSRMRTSRFKVDRRLKNWTDEFATFNRESQKVPRETHPLMSATRFAVQMLPYARALRPKKAQTANYPRLAIL